MATDKLRALVADNQRFVAELTGITPHDTLIALLLDSGIEASETDTGGDVRCVIAPLPEGGELAVRAEDGEWCAALTNEAGGVEWVGAIPSTEALLGWVCGISGRVAGLATSGSSAIAEPARDAARPGRSEKEGRAQPA